MSLPSSSMANSIRSNAVGHFISDDNAFVNAYQFRDEMSHSSQSAPNWPRSVASSLTEISFSQSAMNGDVDGVVASAGKAPRAGFDPRGIDALSLPHVPSGPNPNDPEVQRHPMKSLSITQDHPDHDAAPMRSSHSSSSLEPNSHASKPQQHEEKMSFIDGDGATNENAQFVGARGDTSELSLPLSYQRRKSVTADLNKVSAEQFNRFKHVYEKSNRMVERNAEMMARQAELMQENSRRNSDMVDKNMNMLATFMAQNFAATQKSMDRQTQVMEDEEKLARRDS